MDIRLVGQQIKRLREQRGFSQSELARRVDMNPSGVSRAESGKHGLSLDTLTAIARALGVTLNDLTQLEADSEDARYNRQADPRLTLQCDPNAPPGLRALARDDALCDAHRITPEEWRRLLSCRLPESVRKSGWLQLLITMRAITADIDDDDVTES